MALSMMISSFLLCLFDILLIDYKSLVRFFRCIVKLI